MSSESRFYSIQPLLPNGAKDGSLITTDAASPVQAAEKALGQQLKLHGKVARAQVWTLNADYSPNLVTLYVPDDHHRR